MLASFVLVFPVAFVAFVGLFERVVVVVVAVQVGLTVVVVGVENLLIFLIVSRFGLVITTGSPAVVVVLLEIER